MNLSACFFSYKENRGENDINNLWELFEVAIDYSKSSLNENKSRFINVYSTVLGQKMIKWNITMGLYWIRPYTFINLDSTNRDFITNVDNMPHYFTTIFSKISQGIPDGSSYLFMCEQAKNALSQQEYNYHSLPELSYCAWKNANEDIDGDNTSSIDVNVTEKNYWIYSPGDCASKWDEFNQNGIMGIGWDEILDLKAFSTKDEIKTKLKEIYDPSYSYKNVAHCLWQFANEIKVGDVIFAKKGMHKVKSGIYQTDGNKTLIIDAKYYSHSMQNRHQKSTLYSANLYQIYTYVKNYDKENTGKVSGLLIYAKTDEEKVPYSQYKMGKNAIGATTLDLDMDFSNIKMQLDEIAYIFFQK